MSPRHVILTVVRLPVESGDKFPNVSYQNAKRILGAPANNLFSHHGARHRSLLTGKGRLIPTDALESTESQPNPQGEIAANNFTD